MNLHQILASAAALAFLAACQPAAAPPAAPLPNATPGMSGSTMGGGGFGQNNAGPATSGMGAASAQSMIVGTWRCAPPPAGGASANIVSTYAANGTVQSQATVSIPTPQGQVETSGVETGTWSINGNQLTYTPQSVNIQYVTVGGQPLSQDHPAYQQGLQQGQATIGRPVTSTIVNITMTSMTVSTQGQNVTCTRG